MALFGKKGDNISVNFMAIDGLPGITQGEAVNATLDQASGIIVFTKRLNKKIRVELATAKITGAYSVTQKQITEKDKSVFGRAAAGNLLLGPLGAVIGGMSGMGTKKKVSFEQVLIITYTGNDGEKGIALEIVGASVGWKNLLNALSNGTTIL